MLPLNSSREPAPRPDVEGHRPRVAVVLNGNARSVTDAVLRDLRHVLRDETLYISQSVEQSRFIARHLVNKRFDVVLCGGGDGTFAQCITDVMELRPRRAPAFGVLRLGTGNALATALGASRPTLRGLLADLACARDARARRPLPMLEVDGRLTPFAGVGLDSIILEDYNATKRTLRGTPLSSLGEGAPGYGLAVTTRSLWRFLADDRPELLIRNTGETCWRVDAHGRPTGRPIPRGAVIYRGPVGLASVSSIPYYGFGLRAFPQADRRTDRFQLRICNLDALTILTRLPALFRGEYTDPRLLDFFCTRLSMEILGGAAPVQVGGDEVGRQQRIRVGMRQIQAVLGACAPDGAEAPRAAPAPLAARTLTAAV